MNWRCAVTYNLAGNCAAFVNIAEIDANLKAAGVLPAFDDDKDLDYTITVSVNIFHSFTAYSYEIYYKDTTHSVKLEITTDGDISRAKTVLAFQTLDRELPLILKSFPTPNQRELNNSKNSTKSEPTSQP